MVIILNVYSSLKENSLLCFLRKSSKALVKKIRAKPACVAMPEIGSTFKNFLFIKNFLLFYFFMSWLQ